MAFKDHGAGGRVLTDVGTVVKLTTAYGAVVVPGDLVAFAPKSAAKGDQPAVAAGWSRADGGQMAEWIAISGSTGEGETISATKDAAIEFGVECDAEVGDLLYNDGDGGYAETGKGDPVGTMVSDSRAYVDLSTTAAALRHHGTAQAQKAKADAEEEKGDSPSSPKEAGTPAVRKTPPSAPTSGPNVRPPPGNPRAESTHTERPVNAGAFLAPPPSVPRTDKE